MACIEHHGLLACLALSLCGPASSLFADAAAPSSQVLTIDAAGAGARDLEESGRAVTRQSDQMAGFSWIGRQVLGDGPFYFSGGLRGESFTMDNTRDFPIRRLQDYGAQFSVEYFVGAVKAAYVTLYPGFYFETHPTLASWDVPVELATGIPITTALHGVAGVSYGRFYHHPVPIAGLSWTINRQWRLDAMYPNPALIYTVNENLQARVAGQLLGAGFRADPNPGRSVVQYYVYRVGPELAWQIQPGFKFTSGAGLEYQRVFDYWRASRSFRATSAPYLKLGVELSR